MFEDERLVGLLEAYYEKSGRRPTIRHGSLHQDGNFRRIVQRDLRSLAQRVDLDINAPLWTALLVQSVQGHAQQGHCEFQGQQYPEATIPDIILAANLDLDKIKVARQKLIDDVYNWANLALEEKNPPRRLVIDGQPLLGANFLRNYEVEPTNVLQGMILAGYMDNFTAREKTVVKHPLTLNGKRTLEIGGGETYLVNQRNVIRFLGDYMGLTEKGHDKEDIQLLRDAEVIVDKPGKGILSAYIRRKVGAGTSDDMAFVIIGKRYGIDAMLGAFVVDAVDTYDKCTKYPQEGGHDERIAEVIQNGWKSTHKTYLISEEEITDLIYYAAKGNTPQLSLSSSHRRLVQLPGDHVAPTIVLHVQYVKGDKPKNFPLGFNQVPSDSFYDNADYRWKHLSGNLTPEK